MFEGQRLSYIVPGYTGHIPSKQVDNWQPLDPSDKPKSKIPGTFHAMQDTPDMSKLSNLKICMPILMAKQPLMSQRKITSEGKICHQGKNLSRLRRKLISSPQKC